MYVASIGLQTIMPKSGTAQQQAPSPQRETKARSRDDAPELKVPPAQGLGKFVDKSV
jgi:hypothetical protein